MRRSRGRISYSAPPPVSTRRAGCGRRSACAAERLSDRRRRAAVLVSVTRSAPTSSATTLCARTPLTDRPCRSTACDLTDLPWGAESGGRGIARSGDRHPTARRPASRRWRRRNTMRRRRNILVLVAGLSILAGTAAVAVRAIDEPLRRHIEQQLNASLTGYRVRIGALRLHPLGGSLDLLDSTIAQTANPDPPVARIPRLHASVHWRALLHGALCADFWFDRPVLDITARQATAEVRGKALLRQRSWQEAVQHIYPLKIDLFRVTDGDVTFAPARPFAPLHLRWVNIRADNIRNVRSRDRTYPSDVHLDAFVFDASELRVDGHADFLAEPHAGARAYVSSPRLPLWYFTPLISRYAAVQKGTLSVAGTLEYGPRIAAIDLDDLAIDGIEGWYVRTPENAAEEQRATERTVEVARHASNNPTVQLHAARIRVLRSTMGVVNQAAEPPYSL